MAYTQISLALIATGAQIAYDDATERGIDGLTFRPPKQQKQDYLVVSIE